MHPDYIVLPNLSLGKNLVLQRFPKCVHRVFLFSVLIIERKERELKSRYSFVFVAFYKMKKTRKCFTI
jgi:hypothetical protein